MAEEVEPLPVKRKGKGKLIVVMGIALMLGAGGFFAVTLKSPHGKHELPKIELAEKETELEEFLTNTSNPAMYVRVKITVTLRKDFTEEMFKAHMGDVRDAVLLTLNATSPMDVIDASKRNALKRHLADAMNAALKDVDKAKKFAPAKPNEEWNSLTGPVIKVRFNAIATQ